MEIMREETFGPVLPVMRVRDAMEAVALANDSEYGLTASIFSGDLKRAERLAEQIHTGVVSINRMFAFFPAAALPWGGSGISGIGRRAGPEGILRFTQPQSVVTDTQIGLLPSLNVADPLTLGFAKVMRRVRRVLPRV
jgi:acyl-CoA reductase-like NAD-dependent aldehyde dehydrogenase